MNGGISIPVAENTRSLTLEISVYNSNPVPPPEFRDVFSAHPAPSLSRFSAEEFFHRSAWTDISVRWITSFFRTSLSLLKYSL